MAGVPRTKATRRRGLGSRLIGSAALDAAGSGELTRLETFAAENRAALRRTEGHRGFLAAGRAVRGCFHPLPAIAPPEAGRDARLALHALHRFGSFLKFLSAKNSCSPAVQTNSVAAIHAIQRLVLELHRPTSRTRPISSRTRGRNADTRTGPASPDLRSTCYSTSRRCFLRVRFRASACLARRRSPGFR